MNVKNQLILNTQQFVKCFFADDKFFAVRLIVFIVTGLSAFWFYLLDAVFLFLIRLIQIPGEELDCFIKDDSKPSLVRSVMLIVLSPVAYLRYLILPFLYMIYWACNFLFNCFAYINSLGESGWSGISVN